MEIWLKKLENSDGLEYYDALMKLVSENNKFAKPIPEKIEYDDFKYFINARIRLANNDNLKEGVVPTNTYWVVNKDKVIGYATLKHYADYEKPGGHTGLTLLKEYQNKGIGLIVSNYLENIALNELGIKELIYTSNIDNIQSQKSVMKIGGELVSVHNNYCFYKLDLVKKYNIDIESKKRNR